MNPKEILHKLNNSFIYKDWIKSNSTSYLSHFFCPIDSNFKTIGKWEIGFYNPTSNKITVFDEDFKIKPADDVFKESHSIVEKLIVEDIKVTFEQAVKTFKDNFDQYFAKEIIGNGFVILQKFNSNISWNITFVTKSLKFINLKIDSVSGDIIEHNIINLIDRLKK